MSGIDVDNSNHCSFGGWRPRSIGDANEGRGAESGSDEESGPERPIPSWRHAVHLFSVYSRTRIVPIRTARNSNDEEETTVEDEESVETYPYPSNDEPRVHRIVLAGRRWDVGMTHPPEARIPENTEG